MSKSDIPVTDIRNIKGIGEKKAQAFAKLGVFSLYDLLSFFPRKYEDRTVIKPVSELTDGETVCVSVIIADSPKLLRIRRGMEIVRFRAVDDSGRLTVSFFNQSYVKDLFHTGDTYTFYGKVRRTGSSIDMTNPAFENEADRKGKTGSITPVYRLCSGLNQLSVSNAVKAVLENPSIDCPDFLPPSVASEYGLVSACEAYRSIHFPESFSALEAARERLAFEEFFVLSCALKNIRQHRRKTTSMPVQMLSPEPFLDMLPYSPTAAQMRAFYEAMEDISGGTVMNRLLQGDVGSGKTLVAAMLVWEMFMNGFASALMAPTEILAEQHYRTLERLLAPFGCRVSLLTSSLPAAQKRAVKAALAEGGIDLIVGTHALFSDDIIYKRLGLVITDEQHRFGVAQRSELILKGESPHVLVMSATPIPRTLALIMYGDLDISVLDELPPGRTPVDTFSVGEAYRDRLNAFIRRLCAEGRQVFVVCPMVDENTDYSDTLKSANEHAEYLKNTLPELKTACIHGRMKASEKQAVMSGFVAGEIDILVSTTVIEVGVDVPNAALIIVENADRFGLSQLHQLRGRVGRGTHKSYCVLVSDSSSEATASRLKIMCRTCDGFKIAEEDLRLRGPGDFLGSRQHGLPEIKTADISGRIDILQKAKDAAEAYLENHSVLSDADCPALSERVRSIISSGAETLN